MNTECELVQRDAQPTLVIRSRCNVKDLPQVLGVAYQTLASYIASVKQEPAGPPFAAYHNEDMQNLDLEIGYPVQDFLPGSEEVKASEIPAGRYAMTIYTGPYNEIAPAYQQISVWIESQELKASGSAYEMYLNDPGDTPAAELQTMILFPLIT